MHGVAAAREQCGRVGVLIAQVHKLGLMIVIAMTRAA
jgi:hypothetical protein